jgi:hypothetical protein
MRVDAAQDFEKQVVREVTEAVLAQPPPPPPPARGGILPRHWRII